ncbi:MAG TPA: hypothetical protein DFR83_10895 [Deltaproteobacteria bacterium]|nr:hypothetical protein [Deltaproteobacteria bacterium]
MRARVHQDLPEADLEALALEILGSPSLSLTILPVFATLDHRVWTVFDAHPARNVFVLVNEHTSTGYSLPAPIGTGHTTREGLATHAIQQLAEQLGTEGWAPAPRVQDSPHEATVYLAKRLATSELELPPASITAQGTLVTLDLAGTYMLLELIENGVEIDVIAALRYPGSPDNRAGQSAAENALRSEVAGPLRAIGFEESGNGGLPADMGTHACVSLSYRRTVETLSEVVSTVAATRALTLFLEADGPPGH